MPLGDAAIDTSLPKTIAAIIEGVVNNEILRDRNAVENSIKLLQALNDLPADAAPEVIVQKIADVGMPRFYQTTLIRIVVQMAVSARRETETEVGLGVGISVATVDAHYAAKYAAATAAASTVEIQMVPSPAPDWLKPLLAEINAKLPAPPEQPPLPE